MPLVTDGAKREPKVQLLVAVTAAMALMGWVAWCLLLPYRCGGTWVPDVDSNASQWDLRPDGTLTQTYNSSTFSYRWRLAGFNRIVVYVPDLLQRPLYQWCFNSDGTSATVSRSVPDGWELSFYARRLQAP